MRSQRLSRPSAGGSRGSQLAPTPGLQIVVVVGEERTLMARLTPGHVERCGKSAQGERANSNR